MSPFVSQLRLGGQQKGGKAGWAASLKPHTTTILVPATQTVHSKWPGGREKSTEGGRTSPTELSWRQAVGRREAWKVAPG